MTWWYFATSAAVAVLTAFVSPLGKDWVGERAERRQRRRERLEKELTLVYEPLTTILESGWDPVIEEAVGVSDAASVKVHDIVRNHRVLVTEELMQAIDNADWEQAHSQGQRYDENGALGRFVKRRFLLMRRKLDYSQDLRPLSIRRLVGNIRFWVSMSKAQFGQWRRRKANRGKRSKS